MERIIWKKKRYTFLYKKLLKIIYVVAHIFSSHICTYKIYQFVSIEN